MVNRDDRDTWVDENTSPTCVECRYFDNGLCTIDEEDKEVWSSDTCCFWFEFQ